MTYDTQHPTQTELGDEPCPRCDNDPTRPVIESRTKFWCVDIPEADSVIDDILFPATLARLTLQARGGLDLARISIYTDEQAARNEAQMRLDLRDMPEEVPF